MASRDCKPANVPWMIPLLTVSDVMRSIDFYREAFGFTSTEPPLADDAGAMHASVEYESGYFMMGRAPETMPVNDNAEKCNPIEMYVYCKDVDALCDQARKAGATVLSEPEDMFWGDRIARFQDPDGHRWTFATNVAEFSMPEGVHPVTETA